MIAAIDSAEHALHTEGLISALKDRALTTNFDPEPRIKRKYVLIISNRYTIAYDLAREKGFTPVQWKFIDDPQKLRGFDPLVCVVWLAHGFDKTYLFNQEMYPVLVARNFEVIDMSVAK